MRVLLRRRRFTRVLGLSVVELSGDTEPSPLELDAADIICTTPEKFGGRLGAAAAGAAVANS